MITSKKWLILACCTFLLTAIAYLFGAYSVARNAWPIEEIRSMKRYVLGQSTLANTSPLFDSFGRLTSYPGKTEIECPIQTDKTKVLLVIGQSNSANSEGQRYQSTHSANIINFWNGKCYKAESPLLGTTGNLGESWTLLSNKLINQGVAEKVVIIPSGIGGTPISRWQRGGDLNNMLINVVKESGQQFRVTEVLWHQGESDFIEKTSEKQYMQSFHSLVESLRQEGVTAPIYTSVATKCGIDPLWSKNNPVASAQMKLPDFSRRIFAGPNTDELLNYLDRYDDCHFSGSGQEKFANAWVEAIKQAK